MGCPRSIRVGVGVIALLGSVLHLSSCAPDPEGDVAPCPEAGAASPSFVQEDSAGVSIRVTPCDVSTRPLAWTVDPDPELVLGDSEEPGEFFERIAGVTSLPDGGVAVLDQWAFELRFFDPEGDLRLRVGREGRGPGEFETPFMVDAPHLVDSVLVYDLRHREFRYYDAEGEYRASRVETPWLTRAPAPVGKLDAGMLIRNTHLFFAPNPDPGPVEVLLSHYWVDVRSEEERLLSETRPHLNYFMPPQEGRRPTSRAIPFRTNVSEALSTSGPVLTNGTDFELRYFDLRGELARIIRVDSRRRLPVTARALEAHLDSHLEAGRLSPAAAEDARTIPLPDSMPAFDTLHVDQLGWTWAQLFDPNPLTPTRWMVFDPDGRGHGIVEVPGGLEVHEIGEDFILGVWRDEMRRQLVLRFRLSRDS